MAIRRVVCGVMIEDGCIALVKKEFHWLLPGGKPENGETDVVCLLREFGEELPNLKIKPSRFFQNIDGTATQSRYKLVASVYFVEFVGGDIVPGFYSEITQAKWVKNPEEYKTSDVVKKVVLLLREQGYM